MDARPYRAEMRRDVFGRQSLCLPQTAIAIPGRHRIYAIWKQAAAFA